MTRGLVVDLFAGGGGASTGIERALGRPIDIAVNHSPTAIAMHERNHPHARHYQADVWRVTPREAVAGHPVELLWTSPACTHFSKAKGTHNPKSAKIRSLASVVIRWARDVRPRLIFLENVEEFEDWGPLDNDGQPIDAKKGLSFRVWLGKLRAQGFDNPDVTGLDGTQQIELCGNSVCPQVAEALVRANVRLDAMRGAA